MPVAGYYLEIAWWNFRISPDSRRCLINPCTWMVSFYGRVPSPCIYRFLIKSLFFMQNPDGHLQNSISFQRRIAMRLCNNCFFLQRLLTNSTLSSNASVLNRGRPWVKPHAEPGLNLRIISEKKRHISHFIIFQTQWTIFHEFMSVIWESLGNHQEIFVISVFPSV